MEAAPSLPFTILTFLILLTVLVFVHEWGHYIVARIFGVKVDIFSIGFGKEIFGWRDKAGTHWRVSWIPLGGYVKFFGDATAISNPDRYLARIKPEERAHSFHFKPVWQRFLIVAAGPLINLLLAIVIFTGINLYVGQYPVIEPVIETVVEDSPAAAAGIQPGDRIVEANGSSIETFSKLRFIIESSPGRTVHLIVERNGARKDIDVVPESLQDEDAYGNLLIRGRIGINATFLEYKNFTVFSALNDGTRKVGMMISGIVDFIGRIFHGQASMNEIGGPVKIAQYTGQAAAIGIGNFIYFMAGISVVIGFMNLLPIPLLDGGHLLFYSIEAVKGSPISAKAQEMAAMIGLAFVLGLLFVVTWNDLKLPGLG